MDKYSLKPEFLNKLLPASIQLCIEMMTKVNDRKTLKKTFGLLSAMFIRKNAMRRISEPLKSGLAPKLITILFEGITSHFERHSIGHSSQVLFNIMQWDIHFTYDILLKKVKSLRKPHIKENDLKVLAKSIKVQSSDYQGFCALMIDVYNVCRSNNTPDAFGAYVVKMEERKKEKDERKT